MWHNVDSSQHTYMSSSYRSNRLGLSHWDPYTVHRGSCLELYYCNMVEWFWWDSSLISTTNWFPSVLWHCWFGHLTCENCPQNDLYCVKWEVTTNTMCILYIRICAFLSCIVLHYMFVFMYCLVANQLHQNISHLSNTEVILTIESTDFCV